MCRSECKVCELTCFETYIKKSRLNNSMLKPELMFSSTFRYAIMYVYCHFT